MNYLANDDILRGIRQGLRYAIENEQKDIIEQYNKVNIELKSRHKEHKK